MTKREMKEWLEALENVDCEVCHQIGKYAPTRGVPNGFHCTACGTEFEIAPCTCGQQHAKAEGRS